MIIMGALFLASGAELLTFIGTGIFMSITLLIVVVLFSIIGYFSWMRLPSDRRLFWNSVFKRGRRLGYWQPLLMIGFVSFYLNWQGLISGLLIYLKSLGGHWLAQGSMSCSPNHWVLPFICWTGWHLQLLMPSGGATEVFGHALDLALLCNFWWFPFILDGWGWRHLMNSYKWAYSAISSMV